jgi:hypothetical protein
MKLTIQDRQWRVQIKRGVFERSDNIFSEGGGGDSHQTLVIGTSQHNSMKKRKSMRI